MPFIHGSIDDAFRKLPRGAKLGQWILEAAHVAVNAPRSEISGAPHASGVLLKVTIQYATICPAEKGKDNANDPHLESLNRR